MWQIEIEFKFQDEFGKIILLERYFNFLPISSWACVPVKSNTCCVAVVLLWTIYRVATNL